MSLLDFDKLQDSILSMKENMQQTYTNLAKVNLIGRSNDQSVIITVSAIGYKPSEVELTPKAIHGGIKELRWRIFEALESLSKEIEQVTKSQTEELINKMNLPSELKAMSLKEIKEKTQELELDQSKD